MENSNAFITGNVTHDKEPWICFISDNNVVVIVKPDKKLNFNELTFNQDELVKLKIDSYMIAEVQHYSFGGFFNYNKKAHLFEIKSFKLYDLNHNEITLTEKLERSLKELGLDFPK